MQSLSNAEIIERLKSSNSVKNEEGMTYLYSVLYNKVKHFILQNSGQEDDVKDIFQDGLIAFFKLVKQERVDQTTKVEAYIFSICRNLWFKKIKKNKRETSFPTENFDIADEDIPLQEAFPLDKNRLLQTLLSKLSSGCKDILQAFYFERQSMEEIVQTMNLSSVQIAKNKKYKCMKKLKEMIFESEFYKNSLR